jgi:outer membrane protein OmpA-like peptidoglycan-associated protein
MIRAPSRLAHLLAAASALALILAAPSRAQVAGPASSSQDNTGKRIDHSRVRSLPVMPNTEREGAEFGALSPSSLAVPGVEMVTPAALPMAPVTRTTMVEETLGDTTFESGRAVLLPRAREALDALAERLRDKANLNFEIVGHTDNQRISPNLRKTYPDNRALSEARARAVAEYLAERLALPAARFAASGKGESQPIASNDTPDGMAANRRTVVRAAYVETVTTTPAPRPPARPVAVATIRDDCAPSVATSALPFSISVDGHPIDADSKQVEADRQRCVDVALDRADIQIKYDPLNVAPALNIWALPATVGRMSTVTWRTYTNYAFWLKKAEIRVFVRGQNTNEKPIAILPVQVGGETAWKPPPEASQDLGYVLRVYDAQGRFDETGVKTLSLFDIADPKADAERAARDALSGYGESSLKIRNIAAAGGSVTISGDHIKPGEKVAALGGMPVPVDAKGHFVVRQILPAGPHQVDVAVTGADGRTATFKRNLSIADKDWFYVAVADLTVAAGRTSGPAPIVTTDTTHYDKTTSVDGRLAFYLKGKVLGKYLLTASADTQEQPVKDLFSNFSSKDPNYLLRRIDPNRYYPVYGDDSTIVDDAPTQGKFYVKLERDSSYVMWGDFKTSWTGTELTQYSRGLFGGDLVWNSRATTSSGERRTTLNAFAAEPGTLQSREEFRGTGGSLYYFHRQDLTEGSERLWVEVRDKDSGIVLQRTLLEPSQDYQVDYLQGRLTLRAPLPVTADGGSLVDMGGLSGNPVYLVATYEYVPGLAAIKGSTVGVRASSWLTDWLRVGGSYYHQGDGGIDQKLGGIDATLRYKPGTWISGEAARSKGVGVEALTSITGGFDFTQNTSPNVAANAFRIDAAADLSDLSAAMRGRLTAYYQERDRGFSGPGLITPNGEGLRQEGFAAVLPVGRRAEVALKVDDRAQNSQKQSSAEAALRLKVSPQWGVSFGVRYDDRTTNPLAVGAATTIIDASPTLTLSGARTDAVVRLDYRPLKSGQAPPAADAPIEHIARSPIYSAAPGASSVTADAGPAGSILPSAIGRTPGTIAPVVDPTAAAGVAAARIAGLEYQDWNAYAFVQDTLARNGNRAQNNRAGVGASWQVSRRIRLGGEVSGGDGGAGGKVSADYSPDDRSTLYLSYARETEVPDQNYAGREGLLSVGGRMKLNDQLGVFAETREASGQGPHSLTNGFGVDFAPAKAWTSGVRLDIGRISDPLAGDLKRWAVSANLGYKTQNLKASGTLEYRDDRSSSLGTVAGTCNNGDLTIGTCVTGPGGDKRQTILLKSAISYQYNPAWRMLGSLNLSRSTSSQGDFYDGDYTEFVVGAAYRPVDNDRWNTLFKYTYFYNLPSSGQLGTISNSVLEYTQKSHVLDVDTIYDLRPWLSIGGKLGVRIGELKAARDNTSPWVSSQAELGVLRADLHFVKEWDGLLEFRVLKVNDAHDMRTGALIGLYRHVGEHAKIGAGYNFTDFSDDLTDLSYRSRGVFINAITTF